MAGRGFGGGGGGRAARGKGKAGGPVVCVGEALVDCISRQPAAAVAAVPEGGWEPQPGGAPANVAAGVAKLGHAAAFVGGLGRDAAGERLTAELEAQGVALRGAQQVEGAPTREVLVLQSEAGDRRFAGFRAENAEHADCFLDANGLDLELLREAATIVTGTLGLAYPATRAAVMKAVQYGKEHGATIVVDVNWRPMFWSAEDRGMAIGYMLPLLDLADVMKVTDEEAELMFGIDRSSALAKPSELFSVWPELTAGLVTAGEGGAAYCYARGADAPPWEGFRAALEVDAVDTTGAGDAFTAGFLASLRDQGADATAVPDEAVLRRAVDFATVCGGLTCEAKGAIAAQPTGERVRAALAKAE